MLRAALVAAGVSFFAAPAVAHDFPTSHLDLQLALDNYLARVTVHAFDLALDLGPSAPEDSLQDRDFLARSAGAIFPLLSGRIMLAADGASLPASLEALSPDPASQTVVVVLR
jgi:hypothetical protein